MGVVERKSTSSTNAFLVVLLLCIPLIIIFTNENIVNKVLENALTLIFGIASIIGTIGTIWFGKRAKGNHAEYMKMYEAYKQAISQKNAINWADLGNAVAVFAKTINSKKFKTPDIIFAIDAKSATIAEAVRNVINSEIPIYVGVSNLINSSKTSTNVTLSTFKTNKWSIYIPEHMLQFKDKKILIVHDFAISGDTIIAAKECLTNHQFKEENIETYCLVATNVAVKRGVLTGYWFTVDSIDFRFPWGEGKAR